MKNSIPHKWGSHLPALRWAIAQTSGPVLELGGGEFSTPYLLSTGRDLTTFENDPAWRDRLGERFPALNLVADIPEGKWSVVLVDHEPEWDRPDVMPLLDGRFDIAVVHDVWPPSIAPIRRINPAWFDIAARYRHFYFVPEPNDGPPSLVLLEAVLPPETLPDGRVM